MRRFTQACQIGAVGRKSRTADLWGAASDPQGARSACCSPQPFFHRLAGGSPLPLRHYGAGDTIPNESLRWPARGRPHRCRSRKRTFRRINSLARLTPPRRRSLEGQVCGSRHFYLRSAAAGVRAGFQFSGLISRRCLSGTATKTEAYLNRSRRFLSHPSSPAPPPCSWRFWWLTPGLRT